MGPLTFEARLMGLNRVKEIQRQAGVDLINSSEEARIRELVSLETWPNGWRGDEPRADLPFNNVNPDGSVQPIFNFPPLIADFDSPSQADAGARRGAGFHINHEST
jgi:hypothetical protein